MERRFRPTVWIGATIAYLPLVFVVVLGASALGTVRELVSEAESNGFLRFAYANYWPLLASLMAASWLLAGLFGGDRAAQEGEEGGLADIVLIPVFFAVIFAAGIASLAANGVLELFTPEHTWVDVITETTRTGFVYLKDSPVEVSTFAAIAFSVVAGLVTGGAATLLSWPEGDLTGSAILAWLIAMLTSAAMGGGVLGGTLAGVAAGVACVVCLATYAVLSFLTKG